MQRKLNPAALDPVAMLLPPPSKPSIQQEVKLFCVVLR
jgi:hypothetical protein